MLIFILVWGFEWKPLTYAAHDDGQEQVKLSSLFAASRLDYHCMHTALHRAGDESLISTPNFSLMRTLVPCTYCHYV